MAHDPQLFGIGEFSQITGLSVKALRFYDEKGILRPAQVDASSGYRYYDEESIERARIIAALRKFQFSLEQVSEILAACDDDADLLTQLERQRQAIETRIHADRKTARSLAEIVAAERQAAELARHNAHSIVEKELDPLVVAGVRMRGRYGEIPSGLKTIARRLGRYLSGKPLCLYYDAEVREEDADFEPCFPLRQVVPAPEGIAVRTLPGVRCISLIHEGPYEQLGRSYKRLLGHAKRAGLALTIPSREVYAKGPGIIFRGNPNRYLTEIQIPIAG